MAVLSYRQAGLVLEREGGAASDRQIRDLQRDLRQLGYLRQGIDGSFGSGTERAVRALQHDLLENDGTSQSEDGPAPVRMIDYNRGRITTVTGVCDQALVECLSEILDDAAFPKLPHSDDPVGENQRIAREIAGLTSRQAPVPFLIAILKQESDLKHFHEPPQGDEDTYITIGLDTKPPQVDVITSRGYGAGQYTLFHHPPRPGEVSDFMLDVGGNLQRAVRELRSKFDGFINGQTSGTRADDRIAEFGPGPLRLCKYPSDDPRYLTDCTNCAIDAGTQEIQAGVTTLHPGTSTTFQPTPNHHETFYSGVPVRSGIGCDWPYAVRRYNGSGMDSYHYQVEVLKRLLD